MRVLDGIIQGQWTTVNHHATYEDEAPCRRPTVGSASNLRSNEIFSSGNFNVEMLERFLVGT